MEGVPFDNADIHPAPLVHGPPTLRDGECFHVFISYSSIDHRWTYSLINQLESHGLKVCYHERDFTPGRTVLENMSECIQESQKVMLVLSPEFLKSRWCLLEANMSLFRDCLQRKPIIPVLLEPGVSVPLHLCHITYLEVSDPDFMNKLLKVLCTPNQQLHGSTVVPFQPPSIYNGKALQPLTAVDDEGLNKWESGQFSDMNVPDQLRLIIEDQEKYKRAVRIINRVSKKVWLRPFWVRLLTYFIGVVFLILMVSFSFFLTIELVSDPFPNHKINTSVIVIAVCSLFLYPLGLLFQLALWKNDDEKYILREIQKAVGEANVILSQEKVLLGCQSNSKMYPVYVSLDGCKQEFAVTFTEQGQAEEMFQRAVLCFSSGYAYSLAKRHFPFALPTSSGHLEGGVCFCQYVSEQLNRREWK
ncbi:uncharacterized protein LOC114452120 [Parambassis ranga]|uniref:Uncharacterized protein LOC114452120 n=1 Tax=Parambassis ranga TaxID=210632 RepID=A0A6P7KFN4_9TELE|nr:uncharacterized protein LOC114452120 [Parambassis ranga]